MVSLKCIVEDDPKRVQFLVRDFVNRDWSLIVDHEEFEIVNYEDFETFMSLLNQIFMITISTGLVSLRVFGSNNHE